MSGRGGNGQRPKSHYRVNAIHDEMPKLAAQDVKEFGFDFGGNCYCLHCDERVSVRDVMKNPAGDWCPTKGCDGGGFGIDLYPDPWWRG